MVKMRDDNCSEINNAEKKKPKKGIIYLSNIPVYMTVTKLKEILCEYGAVGRIYLAPAVNAKDKMIPTKKKKIARRFSEGWVEFERKSMAKQVAEFLNNTRIGQSKKSKFYDHIWNMKYLHSFKWVHLSERLAYERAVHSQRVRAEISRAKKEANYFSLNVEKSRKLQKRQQNSKEPLNVDNVVRLPMYRQRETDSEIRANKLRIQTSQMETG